MENVLVPVFWQVGLSISVLLLLGVHRLYDVVNDRSLLVRSKTDTSVYPERTKKVAANFSNQFELPVLFYLACGLYLLFGVSEAAGILPWIFVIARIAHTLIHTTINVVLIRFSAFAVSVLTVIALFVRLAGAIGESPLISG
ncbi:putative membrane protein [Parvularcula bermudensis HTCC2503]|uniref:Putative membrane protein n=1 Tax=Parvularcula bermudensis (strain ATCC BAA-594 / HTCC2503 / KCTC 12087) TaxID=314260 RepID=E0TEB1_PARBH|nr:MAPEG family protein [Parvularcula bermudensis]ADM09486.1 putative membrane protein [Parvularcula bermudensis HTCC2503]